jgi:hypothetical protein
LVDISASLNYPIGKQVENEWVSDTPSEFRKQLQRVFNLEVLKSRIVNLLAGALDDIDANEQNQTEEE